MSKFEFPPMPVQVHGIETAYQFPPNKPLFKIQLYDTTTPKYGGGEQRFKWLVFERGDAVAVLLYRKDTQEIVLTRQFRAPTLKCDRRLDDGSYVPINDGQLLEVIAGMELNNEGSENCAVREVKEETGYTITTDRLRRVATFYSSPGGTSERILLYYAEVTEKDADPNFKVGGIDGEENIHVYHMPLSEFFSWIESLSDQPLAELDAKVLIASLFLKQMLKNVPDAKQQPARKGQVTYRYKPDTKLTLTLRMGDLENIKDVDAWINSENTDMEMDRFIGTSVSAFIRYAGAYKDRQGHVLEDTIADDLRKKMGSRRHSRIGTVHDTLPGELGGSNNVIRIFHVATVQGVATRGVMAQVNHIADVTCKALSAVEKRNRARFSKTCKSALLPMIGTGDQGLAPEIAFPEIVKGIVSYFDGHAGGTLKAVHVCAYRMHDAEVAIKFLDENPDFERLQAAGA
jgi:ADP-ribose pyrophosphatase